MPTQGVRDSRPGAGSGQCKWGCSNVHLEEVARVSHQSFDAVNCVAGPTVGAEIP